MCATAVACVDRFARQEETTCLCVASSALDAAIARPLATAARGGAPARKDRQFGDSQAASRLASITAARVREHAAHSRPDPCALASAGSSGSTLRQRRSSMSRAGGGAQGRRGRARAVRNSAPVSSRANSAAFTHHAAMKVSGFVKAQRGWRGVRRIAVEQSPIAAAVAERAAAREPPPSSPTNALRRAKQSARRLRRSPRAASKYGSRRRRSSPRRAESDGIRQCECALRASARAHTCARGSCTSAAF